jgi:hypothetical protein
MLFVKDRGARNFTINGFVHTGIFPNLYPYKDGLARGWTARVFEIHWRQEIFPFQYTLRPALGPTLFPVQCAMGFFPGS